MLVAILIMLALATILLALAPRVAQGQKAARGADLLQGWLLIAKQRALRDQVPTGIRFQMVSTTAGDPNYQLVRDLQYIQQPDDFTAVSFSSGSATAGTITVTQPSGTWQASLQGATVGVDFFGGFGPQQGDPANQNQALWAVQPGDYLELQGGGPLHQITGVSASMPAGPPPATAIGDTLTLLSGPANAYTNPTAAYRIIRAPRLLTGETPLQMPQDVAIDLNHSNPPTPGTSSYVDILFSPAGGVLGQSTTGLPVILWVRDITQDSYLTGEPRLVGVQYSTGFIAVHPVDVSSSPTAPYTFVLDGRSSGL
jgi:hypothetical protein